MTFRIAIVTCQTLPEPDPDEAPLMTALARLDVEAALVAWDDVGVAWGAFDLAVVRSTWNYSTQPEAFLTWLRETSAAVPLLNPPDVIELNHHKSYLLDLAARGVAVTPTELVQSGGGAPDLAQVMIRRGWARAVVKPAVSAGSRETLRVDPAQLAAGQSHLERLLRASEDVLIQEYLASVEDYGERSLVWIDGEFTHAIRKTPRWKADDESVSGALTIEADERALGDAALAPWRDRLLYGRVDLARDAAGTPRVMELELIEPSLFLVQGGERPLTRLADAIVARAQALAAKRASSSDNSASSA